MALWSLAGEHFAVREPRCWRTGTSSSVKTFRHLPAMWARVT
jgi:hypothetical protein